MREECFLSPPGVSSGSAIFNSVLVRDEDVAKSKQVPCRESPPLARTAGLVTNWSKGSKDTPSKASSLCVCNVGKTISKNLPFEKIAHGSLLIKDYQLFFENVISTSGKT